MKELKLSSELFVLENGDDYIIYLPLKSKLIKVNLDTIKMLNAINEGKIIENDVEILQELMQLGVFEELNSPSSENYYMPTDVTFIPSFRCNLECLYCYSNGGEHAHSRIPLKLANKAIDLVIKNALELRLNRISVGFHGGGEPMLLSNKPFIEAVINYAREKSTQYGLECQFNIVTNGVNIHRFGINWIKANFSIINISFDGPKDIQNLQRPKRGGNKDSYKQVLKTINLFEKNQINYGIRTTITKFSVHRMSEIVEHFTKISKLKSFHFEPLFECGRCKTSNFSAPDEKEFVENYNKASITSKQLGVKIFYSGASIDRISNRFCGAAGDNFFITPDGYVSTCIEACRLDDPDSMPFIIGSYNNDINDFVFDYDKIKQLKSRITENIQSCMDCFCKYSCAGDCLIKVLKNTGNMFETSNNPRCQINTALSEAKIKEMLC
jgi:uncharacterized protein